MGKKIDTFVISTIAAAGFYLYFQHAFRIRWLSVLLALISFAVLRRALRMILGCIGRFDWMKKRRIRRQGGAYMLELAAMPQEEARKKIGKLLETCYGEAFPLSIVQGHPSLSLSQQKIFELWKAEQGKKQLVICATCRSDAACRSFAAALREPRVALLDGDMLAQLIAEYPAGFELHKNAPERRRLHLHRIGDLILRRKNVPRCLLFAASMLLMYLLTASLPCLIFSMALIFTALASLRRTPRPARLF